MKRFISGMAAAAMLAASVGAELPGISSPVQVMTARADGFEPYKVYDDFECDVKNGEVKIVGYRGNASNLIIPSTLGGYPVKAIEKYVFSANQSLTSVSLSSTITTLGVDVFSNCTNLRSVTLPSNLEEIPEGMFANCTSLTTINIPDSVVNIGSNAFYNCSSLTSFTFPSSLSSIGSGAFMGCTGIKTMTIAQKVEIGEKGKALGFASEEDLIDGFKLKCYSGSSAAKYAASNSVPYTLIDATAVSISGASVTAAQCTYNGKEQTPALTVTLNGKTLTSGADYLAKYSNNTNVGTGTVTLTGNGAYTGTKTANFTISKENLSNAAIGGINSSYTYTGSAIQPVPSVVYNRKKVDTSDYTVSYSNNTNVGTATVTVTATSSGNFTGSLSKTFQITGSSSTTTNISGATINGVNSSYTYTGSAIKPVPTSVTLSGKTLVSGTDYTVSYSNNTNVGTATLTVNGKGNYTGSKSINFNITSSSSTTTNISGATINGVNSSYTYTGSAIKPVPTSVTLSGKTLVSGTDYTVSYSNNTNVGTATLIVTGKGNYTGSKSINFSITSSSSSGTSITNATVAAISSKVYTGYSYSPAPTVTLNGKTLTANSDYTLAYANNINAGTATITITGKGSYTGTKTVNYTITPANFSNTSVSMVKSVVYTGSALTPAPTVTFSGSTLKSGTDYTVAYTSNTNVGTATATITGKGNFTGTKSTTFSITAASLSSATISGISANYTYTGSAIKPVPTVVCSGKTLKSGTDYTVSYSNNTNVGTATLTVTGKGNYTGSAKTTFTITKNALVNLSSATITGVNSSYTYTGSAIKPVPTVVCSGKTLKSGTDYTVSYSNNTNVGTATLTVTGTGNYTGSKSVSFTIAKATVNISSASVSGVNSSYTYTGSAIKPVPTVVCSGKTLKSGTDYTVSYSNNTNVGTATITITGIGSYTGSKSVTFSITSAPSTIVNMSSTAVSGLSTTYTYTGAAQTPAPTVTYNGKTLKAGTDYTVAYANNVNVGTVTMTLTGKGNYTGTKTITFKITAANMSSTAVSNVSTSYTYTGSAIKPTPTVKYGSTTLKSGTDYTVSYTNNVNVGTATLTVTGKGNYTGTKSVTFSITKNALPDVSNATVSAISSKVYTGYSYSPAPTVTLNGKTLTAGTDYTLTYSNNVNAGTATVAITGKGNYTGIKKVNYTITPASMSNTSMSLLKSTAYTGSALTPAPTVTFSGSTLKSGTDYTVTYSNNTNAGTATVTVTGKGNFTGTKSMTFTITTVAMSSGAVSGLNTTYTYTGAAQTPAPTVTYSGKTLKAGTDYTVTYKNNTNVGTVTMTITGKGNFTGSKVITFKITAANMSSTAVSNVNTTYAYTGSAIKPAPTVKFGGKTLTLGTDYTVSYSNNTNAGTATMTLTGKGNFTGTKSITFKIVKSDGKKLSGDVNGDGVVDLKDGLMLQQYLAGWKVGINTTNADVTGDGVVDLKDGLLLKQKLSGWKVTLK